MESVMAHIDAFIMRGDARKALSDAALARSLLNTAASDLRFLSRLGITADSARKLTANYYDVLRSLVEAIASMQGFKIYSHEGFTAFLKDCGDFASAEKFDRFRRIRNGIEYFGNAVSVEETRANIKAMQSLIFKFRKRLSEELKKPI